MPSHPPVKFLLVDDLEPNLMALEAILARDGVELLKAHSGREALELLLAHEVTLALIDVQMPEMSGFELADIMRSTERTRHVPIIFLTAGTINQERWDRGSGTGAIDFLPKPIDPTMLSNKARVFYDLARQRQELEESERRLKEANEKLEAADRSKDEFIAMLAHELRNPLAPILTGIDVLLRSDGDTDIIGRVSGMMQRQVSQMSHLIDDLLDVSRITNGKIILKKEDITLDFVIEQAVESVQPLVEARGHELTLQGTNHPWTVFADHHRLTQIVSNLLSNAAKYTQDAGKITLSVREDEDGGVAISVKDNGRGIPPEHQSRIFELFDQGNDGAKDGLGIGLTLVRSLVEMHDGAIRVVSEGEGKGSEFTVRIPNAKQQSTQRKAVAGKSSVEDPMRVLVADDGESTAEILGMFFRMEGMDTRVTYDGAQAVETAKDFQPELACLDLGMPVLDGYESARRIRKVSPDTYLVALSGWGSEEDRKKAAEAGFDEHLVKPVSPDDLRQLMRRMPKKQAT